MKCFRWQIRSDIAGLILIHTILVYVRTDY